MKIIRSLLIQCLVMASLGGFFFPGRVSALDENSIREAVEGAVFIYEPFTTPCAPVAPPIIPRKALRPIGSGFIIVLKPKLPAPSASVNTQAYQFLITARHVIGNLDSVILRINRSDKPEFACFEVKLIAEGNSKNMFTDNREEVDLVAIRLPDLPNNISTLFDLSMILDEDLMSKEEISEGTDIFTFGYLFGYSGNKQNFVVVKFGKVSKLSNETWYHSGSPRNMDEQAYVIQLQSEPGLSGAPVILKSPRLRLDKDGTFYYQRVKPYVLGVLKGGLRSWVTGDQGIAVIEPSHNLRNLLKKVADQLTAGEPADSQR